MSNLSFLRFCNFGNVLSLQKFENTDINEIEQMAKNQYTSWLDEHKETKNYLDYFGPIYCAKPEQFSFSCGDIKMIQQISEYVKSTIRMKGYGYFKGETSRYAQHIEQNDCFNDEELQKKLYDGVLDLLQPYGENVVSLFKEEMVVITNENGVISGRVRCVICDTEINNHKKKKKKRQELYSQFWNGHKWCLSNFSNHHLRKVHPITKYERQMPKESGSDDEKPEIEIMPSIVDEKSTNKRKYEFEKFTNEKITYSRFIIQVPMWRKKNFR